jgi:hypothetical protein
LGAIEWKRAVEETAMKRAVGGAEAIEGIKNRRGGRGP